MSNSEDHATTYIGAEFAEHAEERGPLLRLAAADVEAATGVAITAGMTIEYEVTGDTARVRVLGPDEHRDDVDVVLADWTTIRLRSAD